MSEEHESPAPEAPPATADELARLANEYREAEARLAKAKRAVEADKARRAREGGLAQLADAIRETPEEWELGNATRVFDYARQLALDGVARWMAHRPVALAQRDTAVAGEDAGQVRRYLSLDRRRRKLERWHALTMDARKKLEQSEASNSGPGLMFYVGIATGSPLLSLLSGANSIANTAATNNALAALAAFAVALPRHVQALDDEESSPQSLEALELRLAQLRARTIERLRSPSDRAALAIARYEGAARAELPAVLQALAHLT